MPAISPLPPALEGAVAILSPAAARHLAAWCARRAPHPGPDAVLALAEDVADGRADASALADLRAALSSTACAGTTVGLRHGAANAPSFLAAFAALRDDAHEAAREAARWSLTAHAWQGDGEAQDFAHAVVEQALRARAHER